MDVHRDHALEVFARGMMYDTMMLPSIESLDVAPKRTNRSWVEVPQEYGFKLSGLHNVALCFHTGFKLPVNPLLLVL